MNRQPVVQHIAKFFLRAGRGQGLIQKVIDPLRDVLDGTVYLFAIKGLFGITISIYTLIAIVISKKGIEVILGWLDERWGFWKAENYYTAHELNPFNQDILKRLVRIEAKVQDSVKK